MNMQSRKDEFEQAIAAVTPSLRPLFAISQVAFLMGAMEVINPSAATIMGEVVRSWTSNGGFSAIVSDHVVEQLMEQTGTVDDAHTQADFAAVQMAICTSNILDACVEEKSIPTSALQSIAYSVFDIAPYLGDESQVYAGSPGPVVAIIEGQQEGALKRLRGTEAENEMELIEFSRMSGLRLKGRIPG